MYQAELGKPIDHKQPVILGFFVLHYAKLRMLKLYFNFFTKFCVVSKFEALEVDTDSLDLSLAETEPEYLFGRDGKYSENDCVRNIAVTVSLLRHPELCSFECAVTNTKNITSESLGSSKKSSGLQRCYASVARRTAGMMFHRTRLKSVAKSSMNVCLNRGSMSSWTKTVVSLLKKNST